MHRAVLTLEQFSFLIPSLVNAKELWWFEFAWPSWWHYPLIEVWPCWRKCVSVRVGFGVLCLSSAQDRRNPLPSCLGNRLLSAAFSSRCRTLGSSKSACMLLCFPPWWMGLWNCKTAPMKGFPLWELPWPWCPFTAIKPKLRQSQRGN